MEDRELIREFVGQQSEKAFRQLVDRHLNLVHSTALRVAGDAQLAEEISQAVFLLLARKADGFSDRTVIAGWLYRTTRFVAARALRAERRRRQREHEAFQMQQLSSDETWRTLAPVLDDALDRLSALDRDAVLLRYFENEPLRAVGEKLGLTEEAARKRIDRSVEKLRTFFARRGIHVTATAVTAALTLQSAAASAPATLGAGITSAVFAGHAGSTAASALVMETLNAWRWGKAAGAAAGVAALVAVLFLAGPVWSDRDSIAARPESAAAPDPSGSPIPPPMDPYPLTATPAPDRSSLELQAVDAATGQPIAAGRVLVVSAANFDQIETRTNLATDLEGRCTVPLIAPNPLMVVVGVMAPGYQLQSAFLGRDGTVPSRYTLKVPRGSTIGGVVRDEAGNPVANAGIQVMFSGIGDSDSREFRQERAGFPSDDFAVAHTDAAGRWRFESAPATGGEFRIRAQADGFPAGEFRLVTDETLSSAAARLKLEDLQAQTAVLVLNRGFELQGMVTDEQHRPIAGAGVRFGTVHDSGSPAARTGTDGAFSLRGLRAGPGTITVTADTYAPERRSVDIGEHAAYAEVRLKPGAWLRLRVVDDRTNPVARADVRLQRWREDNTLEWGGLTDADGRIEWNSAPHDTLDIFAAKKGFCYSRDNFITANGEEHTIRLRRQIMVSGFVTDAETRQPVALFKAIPGSAPDRWQRSDLAYGTNGAYQLAFDEYRPPFQVRIEAEGYDAEISPPLPPDAGPVTHHAELRKQNPQAGVRGIVVLPDGNPAAGVPVGLCTDEKHLRLAPGKFVDARDSLIVKTDARGRFSFPTASGAHRVVAIHPQGFGMVPLGATEREVAIELQPWGRIEGNLILRNHPGARQEITLMAGSRNPNDRDVFMLDSQAFLTTTDERGDFVFEMAPPGEWDLFRIPGPGIPFTHCTPVRVAAGETVRVQLGGAGRTLTGRLAPPPDRDIDWRTQVGSATFVTKLPPLAEPQGLSREDRAKWREAFWNSDEGRARANAARSYGVSVQPDGSFIVDDVPPGSYEFNVTITEPGTVSRPGRGRPIGFGHKSVVVPEAANLSAETFDVGTIAVSLNRE